MVKRQANIPSECTKNPYSNACGQALCRSQPHSEDCISPNNFHTACKENPEQCIQLAEVLNTCEGPSCRDQIVEIFKPPGGWPPGTSPNTSTIAGLTPEMREEIKEIVGNHTDPTSTLAGGGEEGPPSGTATQESLARQMDDVLSGVYGGGDSSASLGGGLGDSGLGDSGLGGGFSGNNDGGEGTSKSDLAQQMNDMLDQAYGETDPSTSFAGGGDWGDVEPPSVGKSGLSQQMKKMLNSLYGKKGDDKKNGLNLRNTPLRMGEGYVGTEEDNIFFLAHTRHQDLTERGYFIR